MRIKHEIKKVVDGPAGSFEVTRALLPAGSYIPPEDVAGTREFLDLLGLSAPVPSPVDQVPESSSLRLVFIAAPYSGDGKLDGPAVLEARGTPAADALNARVAETLRVADELIALGLCPLNPLFFHFQNLAFPRGRATWLRLSLELVRRSDIILRLPGPSAGADYEILYGRDLGIPVVYSLDAIREVLDRENSQKTEALKKC